MSYSEWLSHQEGIEQINKLGAAREPFLFVLSFDKSKIFAKPLSMLDGDIFYKLEEKRNFLPRKKNNPYRLVKKPISFETYKKSFEETIEEIRSGNTYLLNLTFPTPLECDLSLLEIFYASRSKFKLYFKDEFICFSPERFVEIADATITTYPMKGTIESSIGNAKELILANPKEMAEHIMIVDLMRNDLGMVGSSVKVEEFRYIEEILAGEKELLQVSSRVSATLQEDWHKGIGTLLDRLTPAGSISGTPKKSTLEIIDRVEGYEREFYTGIFGLFDGSKLFSSVMIRFIENQNGELCYKSGGGITLDSNARSEYEELIDKVYLPF